MKIGYRVDLPLIDARYVGLMTKTILLILGVVLGSVPLGALTVDDAVKQARENNLGLQTEDLKLAQKTDEKDYSFNRLYPTLSASTTLLRLNQINLNQWEEVWPFLQTKNPYNPAQTNIPFSTFTNQLTPDYNWIWSLGVNAQWILNPAVFRGITQTLVDYQTAKITRDAAAARLDRDVRKAFYQLLALHEATGVFDSQLKVAEDRYRLAKLDFDAGLGSEIAALQAQVTYVNRKPLLDDQKLNEDNARAGFRILLNLPDGAPLDLQGSLDVDPGIRKALADIDVDKLVKRFLEGRWDLGVARGTAASLTNLAQLQADSLWPSLIFGWTADPSVQAPFLASTWNNPTYSQYNWSQTNGAFSVTLDWKLDSFLPGSTTGIEIAGRQRAAKEAELGVEQTRRAGETEIRTLIGQLKKSAVALDSLALALDLAQRSSKLTEDGYKAGTQSFTDAQDADLQYQTARLQYLNEELALQSTLADLDYSLAAQREEWFHG
jgi:outer membrane protein TolC